MSDVLAPDEATPEMLDAYTRVIAAGSELDGSMVWRAMLAAAPDQYGNPMDGSSLPFCCYPDCGCDGARLCNARSGPNDAAQTLNRERGSAA